MSPVLQTLIAARQLITDPTHWTQSTSARDRVGREVHPTSPNACQWCGSGAITRTALPTTSTSAHHAVAEAARELFGIGAIPHLNDRGAHMSNQLKQESHAAVLMAFDLAIARRLDQ